MNETERRLCVLAHASALTGLFVPLGQVLGPFLVSLLAPREAPTARAHAIAALNFQLNMLGILFALIGLCLLISAAWLWLLVALPNLMAYGMAVAGAARAAEGREAGYPALVQVVRPPAPVVGSGV